VTHLHVCIDARSSGDTAGGVDTLIRGLAEGLSALSDGDERYSFLVRPSSHHWIEPFISGSASLLPSSEMTDLPLRQRIRIPEGLRLAWLSLREIAGGVRPMLAQSDGTPERAGAHLLHFTSQDAFLTALPSIYHPHDLQHLHFPEFFSPIVRRVREREYRSYCAEAAMVAVSSSWAKRDVMAHYKLSDDKVRVVPLAPGPQPASNPELGEVVRARLRLPDTFIFYPAQTWPHKNHLGLIDALGLLHRRGLPVSLVCSGRLTEFFDVIRRAVEKNGLTSHVRFVGFVQLEELAVLYTLCRAVVIPTRFEAASFPVWEAFRAGKPVGCSRITSLPAQADDAALLFEPGDIEGMAAVIERLWKDERLRAELGRRGRANVQRFTWYRTAELFRAHYRRLANRELTKRDESLLTGSPLL